MLLLKLFGSTDYFWKMLLGSVIAIAPVYIPAVALAQNQSDVTGPNLSDVTGPNLSDNTGPNQSDNTGLLGEEIFQNANGEFVTLEDFFQDFLRLYGEDFGLESSDDLAERLTRVSQTCTSEEFGTRRFSRTPGSDVRPVSAACSQFNELMQMARQSVAKYKQSGGGVSPVNRRVW